MGDDSHVMIPSQTGTTNEYYEGGPVSELDEAWAVVLNEAEQRARRAGHGELAEYLSLRKSNDLLRQAGVDWLMTTFNTIAGEMNRTGAGIQVSRTDSHRFHVGNSTMAGTLLTLGYGVRMLYVEAGWPRTPRDGIVRGAGLAYASIRHLGLKRATNELLLVTSDAGKPAWAVVVPEGGQEIFHELSIKRHIVRLLDRI
ncbi:MAG: hypothetical protein ABR555_10145 [Pyrinomonadaceae bacterium]